MSNDSRALSMVLLALLGWIVAAAAGCGDPRPSRAIRDASSGSGDADGDGISDADEGAGARIDTDGDGTIDAADTDSDQDGIDDSEEAGDPGSGAGPRDSDADGTADFRDLDSDGNGLPDAIETRGDSDADGLRDFADMDDDGDLVPDLRELQGEAPFDADGDGAFDHQDPDADGDTILDGHEHGYDTDRDALGDARDLDSDEDGWTDAEEAGDAELMTPPLDTDLDGIADFRDPDGDGDGLSDLAERESGTSRTSIDSDADGVDDLVEVSYGSDPLRIDDSPRTRGDFVFVVPYSAPSNPAIEPAPARDTLSFSTSLRRVDVYVAIDTSGSMEGEIGNLTAGFRTTIVPEILRRIPEAWFGVGRFEDCPSGACASGMNNLEDMTGDPARVEAALRSITSTCGGSEPYRQMLWLLASGDTAGFGGRTRPAPRRCTDPASVGWPCFRTDAVRIVVQVGDEPMSQSDGCTPGRTQAQVIDEMNRSMIRYVGITSMAGSTLRADMEAIGRGTGSVSAATSMPFVYTISESGAGLSTTIVDAIEELAANVPIRVDAIPRDDASDAIDAVASFVERIETHPHGTTVLGRACSTGLEVADEDGDADPDHFPSVLPGARVCFDIVARPNRTVPNLETPQIFRATIDVVGDRFTPLDSREVYFVVPPSIPDPGGPG